MYNRTDGQAHHKLIFGRERVPLGCFTELQTADFTHKTGLIEAFKFRFYSIGVPSYSDSGNGTLLHKDGLARCKAQLREPASQDGFMADGRNTRREIFVASEETNPLKCRSPAGQQRRYFRQAVQPKGRSEQFRCLSRPQQG